MNVVFVNYQDFTSNSAVHICNLAKELTELGVDCAVAVPGDPRTVTLLGNQPFQTLGFKDARNGGLRFPDGKPPTIIHAWTPREVVRELTEELSTRHRCPYVVHLEDNEEAITASRLGLTVDELRSAPPSVIDLSIVPSLSHPPRMQRLLAGAAGVSAILDTLLEFRPEGVPGEVVWPGFEPELFTDEPGEPELRRALGVADDEAVIVYAGNSHPTNAEEMRSLYLAVGAVNRTGRPLRLVRLGRDYTRFLDPELESVSRHVVHVPLQPRSEVPRYMRLADVLVQPGHAGLFNDYRFPSKLPEFLACGRPVVLPATNLGRFLVDGEDCLLLQRGDALEIAAAIERLLDDDDLRARLGRGGRAFAERSFSWSTSARKLASLYEQALDGQVRIGGRGDRPPRSDTRPAAAPPATLSYATAREYCEFAESLPSLMTARDLKDVQRPWALNAILATVPRGSRLLEIGAGEPLVADLLTQRGYDVTVVDPYDGRGRGPTELRALRAAFPNVRIVQGLFPEDAPSGERFDCVYSISVLEHLPPDAVESTCAGMLRFTRAGGCTIHAIDHVVLGQGAEHHREQLGRITGTLGVTEDELEELLGRLVADPDTYFLSAESHNRWRGRVPYDEFPMRRCVSIQLCLPVPPA